MAGKPNLGKILFVIFLTVLIWIWADLAQDESYVIPEVRLSVARSGADDLWVHFNESSTAAVRNVRVRGQASKIAEFKRDINLGKFNLEFFIDQVEMNLVEPGEYSRDVLEFLRMGRLRKLGLVVDGCEPSKLEIDVDKLVEKSLSVKCYNDRMEQYSVAKVEPAQIRMLVPSSWEGEALNASVVLSSGELGQSRVSAIEKKPFIRLGDQLREWSETVRVSLPSDAAELENYFVTARLGISLSPNLQGKYWVKVNNLSSVLSAIPIRSTLEAKISYESQKIPQMTLYVFDEDKNTTGELRRSVVYNFPVEYVSKGQVELKGSASEVKFELIPLDGAATK